MSNRDHYYSETFEGYDLLGNVGRVTRKKNNILVDDVHLSYAGNQIVRADERASKTVGFTKPNRLLLREYGYDANGNMSSDLNKGIAKIEYNFLNLPFKITGLNNEEIIHLYSADGRKLHTRYKDSSGAYRYTDYVGDYVYDNVQLSYVVHPEGLFSFTSGLNGEYWWYQKDHLGSIRMVVNASNELKDCNEYYAFGGLMNERSVALEESLSV